MFLHETGVTLGNELFTERAFTIGAVAYAMRILFSAFVLLGISIAAADNLATLKVAAARYVNDMKIVLALRKPDDCIEVIDDADEFATAKMAFYDEARQALPNALK